MTNKDEVNPRNIPLLQLLPQEITKEDPHESSNQIEPINKTLESSDSCQYCCCRFPKFIGSIVRSSRDSCISNGAEYKPYFELETEEERLSYEFFKLLARVTYDEVLETHREQGLEELHEYRLSLLLEELRLIEETVILYLSSDECFSRFEFRIPNKRRSLRIKNKKIRFQRQKFRK